MSAPTLLDAVELERCVTRLGGEISADHPEGVVLVGVLKGSFCFLADLARCVHVTCMLDFLGLSAYAPGARRVRILKDLDIDVAGRDIVLVKDIVDTGLSVRYAVSLLEGRRARQVRVCTLLDRPVRRIVPVELAYVGKEVGEEFLVGYGLDFAQRYRNLAEVRVVEPEALVSERERFEEAMYPGTSYHADGARG